MNPDKLFSMVYENIEKLKQKLHLIKFGILKTQGTPFLQLSRSFIIKTCKLDYEGYLWCTADLSAAGLVAGKGFAAQLKYVHKPEGLFIKLTGHASVVDAGSLPENELAEEVADISKTKSVGLFKIQVQEVQYYKKQSISACTSFLQAINIFNFNNAVLKNR